jgi:hypothetical protein
VSDQETAPWLKFSLGQVTTQIVAMPNATHWPLVVREGEIRVARAMDDPDAGARLIVVLEVFEGSEPWVNGCLVTDVVEAAGHRDVQLDPADTALPFTCLVETDVVAPFFVAQLGPLLGRLGVALVQALRAEVDGSESSLLAGRRGIPIIDTNDARWRFKTAETELVHKLARACLEQLTHGEDLAADALVDPTCWTAPSLPGLLALASQLHSENLTRAEAPTDESQRASVSDWVAGLGSDEMRALEPVWHALLRASAHDMHTGNLHYEWSQPWNAVGTEALSQSLVGHAARGRRSFRVLTLSSHWPTSSRPDSPGVLAVDIEALGRIQVKPERVRGWAA